MEKRIEILEERNMNLGEANKELRLKNLDLEDENRKLKLAILEYEKAYGELVKAVPV